MASKTHRVGNSVRKARARRRFWNGVSDFALCACVVMTAAPAAVFFALAAGHFFAS
jgi:hypothetical protein